ncbi:MAG: type I-E CRISPR-associated protein Cse2/CasB [Myxococcota bacterium]
MNDGGIWTNQAGHSLRDEIREVRRRYDQLGRAARAALRRCRTADEIALADNYWKIGRELANAEPRLRHVVLLFPEASHVTQERFSFGRFLRKELSERRSVAPRLRRVLDSRDREELCDRLRGLLRRAAALGAPVDWGVLGADIACFFSEGDHVRRCWAQDFYAPLGASVADPLSASAFDARIHHEHLR